MAGNLNLTNGYGVQQAVQALVNKSTGSFFYVASDSNPNVTALDGLYPPDLNGLVRRYSTIDAAINACTASTNNMIFVAPGHTETVAGASGITFDVAGVSLVGLGTGNNRPVLTFSATASTIVVSAANVSISNIVLTPSINAVVSALVVTGNNCTIDVESQDASATVEFASVLRLDTADNATVKLKHLGFIAGDTNAGLITLDDTDNASIEIDTYGVVTAAGWVNFVDSLSTNVSVRGRMYTSGITNYTRDVVDTIGSSIWDAVIFDASLGGFVSGGSASALAPDDVGTVAADVTTIKGNVGGVDSATNVLGADDADNQFASTNVAANRDGSVLERLEALEQNQVDDVAGNALGFDDANNVFSSSSVVANLDGSILERLEALMDPLGGYDPVLGFRVTKTGDPAAASGLDALFTVTGRCLITHLSGEVTTQLATVTTIKITDVTNTVDLCAATTVTNDVVGTMYALPGLSAEILNGTGGTPVVGSVPAVTIPSGTAGRIVGDAQAALTLQQTGDQVGTGAIAWVLYYKPLTSASSIVAAA